MKKILTIGLFLLASLNALALVSGSDAVKSGESRVSLETQIEAGLVEPNANKASYQTADIKIYRLKYSSGLKDFSFFLSPNLNLEFARFTSAEERVGANLFYQQDSGSYVNLGFSADLVHDPDRKFSFYLNFIPSAKYNEKKFSNPRLDKFSFGITSAFNVSENIFQKNLIHYGSGDSQDQNSSIAVDTGFGFRLNELINVPVVVSSSLFLEADLKDRFDSSYDVVFSPSGQKDRIRSFKYGTLLGLSAELNKDISFNFEYLQKLGGYDARATQITKLGINYKF